MKYLICTLTLFFALIVNGLATPDGADPIKIEPITKVAFNHEFYAEQAELWKAETLKSEINADAWLNYYKAARYANMFADSLSKRYDMDKIVAGMPTALANTFEFNYVLFIHDNNMDQRFDHLLKAHELAPERIDAYHSMVHYHVIEGNQDEVQKYCKALFEAGEFSPTVLAWNFNMLTSIEENGILLTHGDNDTYPSWVIQTVKNNRKDVKVLNVNLLMYDKYRERIFQEEGISQIASAEFPEYQDMYLAIVRQIARQSKKPVYVATSVPEFIRNAMGDSLYLVGLAFRYSDQSFDNMAFLKNNFENKFLKDHLRIQLEPDTGSNVLASMNMHYLPAIITLRNHYLDSGEKSKASSLEPIVRKIAREAGNEAYISSYLGGTDTEEENFTTSISARALQKGMVHVRKNLYAGATEVTNEQYEAFLMDLLKNKEYALLEKCKAPKTDWRSLLPDRYENLSEADMFPNGHPDDPGAPVQNISFEAANEYCKWITKVYNNSTDRKKQYGEVEFRLPTEEEWEFAAHGNMTSPFPWGGYYYKNSKGCFLFNTEVSGEEPCVDCPSKSQTKANDGGFFPVPADAYFPNNYGLYNTAGNVAEMISVKHIAKGGSWEDKPDDSKIISQKKYDKPSPAIGFRVFMETK